MSEVLASRPRPVPPALPPLLSFAAGFIDSFTVLALFGMFVAQVTGSFVLAAAAFVTKEQGAVTKVLAIPVFLLAAVVTTSLAIMVERRGRAAVAWALGLECVVLTGFVRGVCRRAAGRSQRGCCGDPEPARPFRHGHAERDGAVADEERRIDQRDDHEHDTNRYRRDRTWFRVARPPPRSGQCRRRRRLRRGLHASRGP